MMNRRQFVCAAAAGPVLLGRAPKAFAATYDLIIRGGRIIDPSVGIDAIRDVAIAGGKIVAVEANIAGDATETIDARNKIVVPGPHRHPYPCGAQQGRSAHVPAGRRHRVGRCRFGRSRQHRRGRDRRARSAADRPLLGQHRAHRSCAERRVARPQSRQRGSGSRCHLTQSRCRYRRQGAPLGQCHRAERSRSAPACPGRGAAICRS